MDRSRGYIAVDWGTSNRRAYRIGADGRCEARLADGQGVLSIPAGGFEAAVDQLRQRLGDLPLLLAGMAGSTRGWMDAPYLPCPVGLCDLAANLVWAEPGRSAIVPGVGLFDADRPDIMRGEEVQIFGALAAKRIPPDCLLCHPGTHNKWVQLRGGRIESFRTVMTGEMFNLLARGSLLGDHLGHPVRPGEPFLRGVRRGLEGGLLTADIFSVRPQVLLGRLPAEEAAPFLSGLLIGADVRSALPALEGSAPFVIGDPALSKLYAAALEEAGRQGSMPVDGEEAFLAGAGRIAEMIE